MKQAIIASICIAIAIISLSSCQTEETYAAGYGIGREPRPQITVPTITMDQTAPTSISEGGLSLIKQFEGYIPYAIWDYKQYSYGYGNKADYEGQYISEADAELLLLDKITIFEQSVAKFAEENDIILTQNQFDALVSFCYNLGAYVWYTYEDSNLVQLLKSGNYTNIQITDAFGEFCIAGGKVNQGLVNRRAMEAELFCKGE